MKEELRLHRKRVRQAFKMEEIEEQERQEVENLRQEDKRTRG